VTPAVLPMLLAALAAPEPASGAMSKHDQAEALVRDGIQLRRLGDDQAAVRELQKAYDLERSPRVAAQFGLAEQAIGRWADAAVHVGEALRSSADPWIAKNRKQLEPALALIKTHIGRIEVVGEPQGAALFVNGRAAGHIPTPEAILVNAGAVDVEVRAEGYARTARSLQIGGGQYQQVVIRLEKEPTGVAPAALQDSNAVKMTAQQALVVGAANSQMAPPTVKSALTAPTSGPKTGPTTVRLALKWSALGLAGVGVGVGVTAAIIHRNNARALSQAGCFDRGGTAVDVDGNPQAGCQPTLDYAKGATLWEIVGFTGAGIFAATWLVLALTEPRSSSGDGRTVARAPSWTCQPSLLQPGVVCAGRL
jgi:hypothetical protein